MTRTIFRAIALATALSLQVRNRPFTRATPISGGGAPTMPA